MNGLCLWQNIQMAMRHTERHSASPISREMQTKTTMRCHLTAIIMAKIKNRRNNRCHWGYGEEGGPLHSWWAGEQVQPLWKTLWRVLEKLKIGDPWVAQRFDTCLWPMSRSWRPGIESHVGLTVHGACFSLCLCLCLSLCDYHKKKLKKEVKNRPTLRFQNCRARYLPRRYKSRLVDSKWDTQPSVSSSVINNSQTVDTAQMSIDWWMGRDDVVNIPTATSLGHQKRWKEAIYNDVGEVERTYA